MKKFENFLNYTKNDDYSEWNDGDFDEEEQYPYDIDPFGDINYRKSLIGKRVMYRNTDNIPYTGTIKKIHSTNNFREFFYFSINVDWDDKENNFLSSSSYYSPVILKLIN